MATTTVESTTSHSQAAGTTTQGATHPARKVGALNRGAVISLAGAAVVAIGAYVWVASGHKKEAFAQQALTDARNVAEAGNLPLASTQFQKIIQTYKGTDAAMEAVLSLNQARLINGQNELAVVGLRDFLASKPPAKFESPAAGLLGEALENAQRPADAAAAYRQAASSATVGYLKAEFLLSAGRAYEAAGKPDEAEKAYREIIEKYNESGSLTEAQVRLAELTKGKLPPVPEKPKR